MKLFPWSNGDSFGHSSALESIWLSPMCILFDAKLCWKSSRVSFTVFTVVIAVELPMDVFLISNMAMLRASWYCDIVAVRRARQNAQRIRNIIRFMMIELLKNLRIKNVSLSYICIDKKIIFISFYFEYHITRKYVQKLEELRCEAK